MVQRKFIHNFVSDAPTACNTPPTPPPPPTPTPAPPPEACESPEWFGDNYCDDDNNNEECGWDGGDCCGDNVNTQYCTACECLDPNGGGSAPTSAPTPDPSPAPTPAPPSPTSPPSPSTPPPTGDCGEYFIL